MEQYEKALKLYDQIPLHGKTSNWVLRNTGFCYRKLEDYENALKIYLEAAEINPDDQRIESLIGYCNLKLEQYETALKHYFKIEYMNPENTHVIRPIAWCYFALGEYDKSAKYYTKVFELGPDYYDYVNFGHLKWATGDRKSAIDNYILSTNYDTFNFSELQKTVDEDTGLLIEQGIDRDEISLMMDYLRYKLR